MFKDVFFGREKELLSRKHLCSAPPALLFNYLSLQGKSSLQIWGHWIAARTFGEKPNTLGRAAAGPLWGLKCWEVSGRGVSAKMKRKFPQAKYLWVLKCFLFARRKESCTNVSHRADILISLETEGEFHPWHQRVKHIWEMGRRREVMP